MLPKKIENRRGVYKTGPDTFDSEKGAGVWDSK